MSPPFLQTFVGHGWSSRFFSVVTKQRAKLDQRSRASTAVEGFALIDVLVALALVGVISSLMIVFLGQARSMIRIGKATEMQMEVDAASRFLETAISHAEPLPLSGSSPENVIYLNGDASRIEFNGVQAIGFRSAALREIAISLASGNQGGNDLSVVQKPRRGNKNTDTAQSEPVRLIAGVTTLKFEYLDGSTGTPLWQEAWSAKRRLPTAVRFTISVIRDGAAYSSDGLARLGLADISVNSRN